MVPGGTGGLQAAGETMHDPAGNLLPGRLQGRQGIRGRFPAVDRDGQTQGNGQLDLGAKDLALRPAGVNKS